MRYSLNSYEIPGGNYGALVYGHNGYTAYNNGIWGGNHGYNTNEGFPFIVEFTNAPLQTATNVGGSTTFGAEHDGVTCNNSDAGAAGWVDGLNGDLSVFDTVNPGDGIYEGITRARWRVAQRVYWGQSRKAEYTWDGNFRQEVYFQAQVKQDINIQVDDSELFALMGHAYGDIDAGTGQPDFALYEGHNPGPAPNCRPHESSDWILSTNTVTTTTGWCSNSFIDDATGIGPDGTVFTDVSDNVDWDNNAGVLESAWGSRTNNWWHASGAVAQIVGARVGLTKVNVEGLNDIADNGQLVQYSMRPFVTGSNLEALTNVYLIDYLPAQYQFVRFVQLPTTPGATCAEFFNIIRCQYSEPDPAVDTGALPAGLAGGWPTVSDGSSEVIIEVRVQGAVASQTTSNGIKNSGSARSTGLGPWNAGSGSFTGSVIDFEQSASSGAYSYLPLAADEGLITKSLGELAGPCPTHPTQDPVPAGWEEHCQLLAEGENIKYTLTISNHGNTAFTNIRFVDVLPYNNDAVSEPASNTPNQTGSPPTTGDARTPGSDYAGTLNYVAVFGASTVYVSGDAPNTISRDPDAAELNSTWCTNTLDNGGTLVMGGGACPATKADVTAVYAVMAGSLNPEYSRSIQIQLKPVGYECDDIWTNTSGLRVDEIYLPIRSQDVSVMPNCGPATLGNYVWLDEDNDGEQDAGEHGIANVVVTLTPPAGVDLGNGAGVAISTTTDANGGYLFADLPAVDGYVVSVNDTQSALNGLEYTVANNGGNSNQADFGNQDPAGYTIDLSPGEVDLSADFGFNHNTDNEVNNNTGVVAIGDTIWIDADGNGIEDPSETPVSGVEVTLYDEDGTIVTTATTDANGYYLFDNLSAGVYSVRVTNSSSASSSHDVLGAGYTQTGDPDHFGTTGPNNDNYGSPVVLAPGDVFLNMDFGYQPTSAVLNSVGDTIWYDADADGNGMSLTPVDGGAPVTQGAGGAADAIDYPIAGVTVALIDDLNDNGLWDANEPIIASDMTDANGQYLFDDLPDGSYIVWVNDTNVALDGLVQTYDRTGALDNMSAVDLDSTESNATSVDVRDHDFGYSDNPAYGSIGDTVWFDVDGSGGDQSTQGAEPGIEGVTVNLFLDNNSDGLPDSSSPAATMMTDETGNYLFEGLPFHNYIVAVDTNTLPPQYNTTATHEPDGDTDGYGTTVTLDAANPHSRDQDFSYTLTDTTLGSIGDTIWGDLDSSGGDQSTQGSEPGLAGVTVQLLDSNGFFTTTVTDENGNYLFPNLPTDVYRIYIYEGTLPNGFTRVETYEPDVELDGNGDPVLDHISYYTLTVGEHNRTQDFSYPPEDGNYSIGDYLWFDVDSSGNGQTGSMDEPPLSGVVVNIFDNSGVFTGSVTTDEQGYYLFTGLVTGTYTIQVETATLPSYVDTTSTYDGSDGTNGDSNSMVTVNATNPHARGEDFSYPPAPVDGTIGDTVWLDLNGDGDQDPDEQGIGGVMVTLQRPDGIVITTTTDSNGNYIFTDLAVSTGGETYIVNVVPSSLPNGVTQTYDFDGVGSSNQSTVTLTTAAPIRLDQDFGYTGDNRLGNLVWMDTNGDGHWDGVDGPDSVANTEDDEPVIAGVTIDVYMDRNGNNGFDSSDTLVATVTTTNSVTTTSGDDGNYLVEGLPDATYFVNVSDNDGVLNGYWHSLGTANMTDESQDDAYYMVDLDASNANPASVENLTADFGYYMKPAALGNYVWMDTNGDGLQNDGETGLNGIEVMLTIGYPNGTNITVTTMTANDSSGNPGWYSFNVQLDEDFNGDTSDGNADPTYTIAVDTNQSALSGYTTTQVNVNSNSNDLEDSDDYNGVTAMPVQGLTNVAAQDPVTNEPAIASFDFGFVPIPSIAVEKIRNTPDPVIPGATVTFTIRITNTGTTTITTLPLTDTYSTAYLTYVGLRTTPESDTTANSGQIVWSDLTQAAPNGFGMDFAPDEVWDVVVEFAARLDTTSLPNNWTINTAQVYTHTVTDTVRIYAPTNVVLSSREVEVEDEMVVLSWSTADETDLIGFHVLRLDDVGGEPVRLTNDEQMILAEGAGNGAEYRYEDIIIGDADANHHYALEMVMADGTRPLMDMGTISQAPSVWMVYLPVLRK
ncbi:MAG: SdrD B-like domain-containing protein [Chloroflexota bacterium]